MTKIDELRISIASSNPTFILITETWLHSAIPDTLINIPQYKLYRNDREIMRGGGVCIYVKESLNGNKVFAAVDSEFNLVPNTSSLWLRVRIAEQNLLIACIYRPNYLSQEENLALLKVMDTAMALPLPTFIFGDFNYPEIDWKSLTLTHFKQVSSDFLDIYQTMNAYQLITFPTRFRGDQCSLLDLAVVNDKKTFIQHPHRTPYRTK